MTQTNENEISQKDTQMSTSTSKVLIETSEEFSTTMCTEKKDFLHTNLQMSSPASQDFIATSEEFSTAMYTDASQDLKNREEEFNTMYKEKKDFEQKGIHWYYAPAFLLFWLVLFFAVVIPTFFYLPDGYRLKDNDKLNTCTFIAERAERILYDIEKIGPRIVGSFTNENITVEFLLKEIEKIRNVMDHSQYDMELDVQVVSGAYIHWHMINMYQGVQNVVVKLAPKQTTSQSYLLLNSHFDSKPGSPGSGDDGAMVVIMLEVLRVLASAKCPTFVHPIVFLFNGAEENPLQTSHGFITQHKWAKNCKAVMNLDCAGSGHREILFQGGPNHPWLMKYYGKHVERPFATSVAEEIFETGLVPSDTDFRIFKNFGNVPGLDLVHSYNGYVYHTAFDKMDVIPLGTLQMTGDHILALSHGLANAPEMEDPSKHEDGHTVFYDFLGLFFVYYTETTAKIINTIVSLAAIIVPAISIWRMGVETGINYKKVLMTFLIIFLLHFAGFLLAFGIPLLIATFYDLDNRSMTWFSNKWLLIGQYICPAIFGLAMPTLLYFSFKKKQPLPKPFLIQMALHSHALILALICIIVTFIGIRSGYLFMVSLFFYVCTLIINLLTKLHSKGYLWLILLYIGQIMPFLYFTYLIHALLCTCTPMFARFGSEINPDLMIALLIVLGTVLSMGFVVPTLSAYRHPKSLLFSLWIITFIFAMISVSSVGFPYRPKTSVGRVNFLHVRRVFYNYDGTVERNESGYYFDFQDRRMERPIKEHIDTTKIQSIRYDCDDLMMCGVPTFNHRWYKARKTGMWLPSESPLWLPGTPTLELLSKKVNNERSTVRFDFKLTAPPHFGIFFSPIDDATIDSWTFLPEMLEREPPYHVFFSYGKDDTPLSFYFEIKKPDGRYDVPLFELGIAAHYVSYDHSRGPQGEAFIKSFPDYIHVMEWPSSYERFIY